jgi:hypothetical protein
VGSVLEVSSLQGDLPHVVRSSGGANEGHRRSKWEDALVSTAAQISSPVEVKGETIHDRVAARWSRQLAAVNAARIALVKLICVAEWYGSDPLNGADNKAKSEEGIAALDQLVEAFA